MMKRFWVFILLFLAAGFATAQDMPPLPSDAPASAVPAKDTGMPALPDAPASSAAPAAASDLPALPDAAPPAAAAPAGSSPATSDLPALPDAGAGAAPKAAAPASPSDMPALPDAGGAAPSASASASANGDMPPLPDSSTAPAKTAAAPEPAPKPVIKSEPVESKPWMASKARPQATFGGWVKAKGGNVTSKLSWSSQQVLNALDAKGYKMSHEEGVYEGEQNKGAQKRKFTFNVPHSNDTVLVLLKQVGEKVWLRVGPDEEPAPADHTYAQVAKIAQQSQTVLHILHAKFGARMAPHRMVPSWEAKFDRHKETLDE